VLGNRRTRARRPGAQGSAPRQLTALTERRACPTLRDVRFRGGTQALAALSIAMWLSACGSSGGATSNAGTSTSSGAATTSSSSTTTTPSTSSTTTSAGPATATITITGDPSVAGVLANPMIICLDATLSGQHISITGTPATAIPNTVSLSLDVSDGAVALQLGSGNADTLRLRQFMGSGVTGFDAGKGAQFSGPVSEVPVTNAKPGSLGAVTGVSGSVSCGNQTTGSSTVTVTGSPAEGALSGTMSPFRVSCSTFSGMNYVGVRGVTTVGATPQLMIVSIGPAQISVALVGHFYTAKNTGQGTVTATGGHVAADVVDTPPAGTTAHTLHVAGDLTCGPA
jgi:hypothetical protein